MPRAYMPRIADELLGNRLEARGAVLVEGPKWCGKTTTARQRAASAVYMADPALRSQNLTLADVEPAALLRGEVPMLIDEWQLAPQLWDAVRFEVDVRDSFGQFILTGSSVPPATEKITHTGTGRISRLRMRPMSLVESGDSQGEVSLRQLFDGEQVPVLKSEMDLAEVAYLLCRGGWPRAINQPQKIALQQARDYVDAVVESDISRVDGVERDPHTARRLMRSYARMVSSQGRISQIAEDLGSRGSGPSIKTVRAYLTALERIFVIEDLAAWNPNLRSKSAIRTSDTRHFVDPSIATAALGVDPNGILRDLETFGLLFESLCVRDLRVYTDALEGDLFHFRDKRGLECDAVIHLHDGRYGLVEVTLGGEDQITQGAAGLRAIADNIDRTRMPEPSFTMVLTAVGGYSLNRPDGVKVVPIGMLGP